MTIKIKISKRTVDGLAPAESRYVAWDLLLTGFGVRVSAPGNKTYIAKGRLGGGRSAPVRWITIGKHGPWTPELARKRAEAILRDLASGIDPTPKKVTVGVTADRRFDALWQRHVDEYVSGLKSAADRRDRIRVVREYALAELGERDVGMLRVADIAGVLNPIAPVASNAHLPTDEDAEALEDAERRGNAANYTKLRSTLSKFFGWLGGEGLVEFNPVLMTRTLKTTSRSRVISTTDLAWIWAAADEHLHPSFAGFIKAMILTGQRREQLRLLTWSQTGDWLSWSADEMKMTREHRIPVTATMRALLDQTMRIGEARYVFTTEGNAPLGNIGTNKKKLEDNLPGDWEHWIFHDFRRSFSTWCAENDVGQREHVEAILAHQSGSRAGVAGVYNRARYERQMPEILRAWNAEVSTQVAEQRNTYLAWLQSEAGSRIEME